MAEYKYYDRLKKSLEQTIAFKNGDRSKARVSVCEIPVPDYKAADKPNPQNPLSQQELIEAALLRKGTPIVTLEADEHGNIIIDKEKHPDLYDWANDI